jgi:hypothetical protein
MGKIKHGHNKIGKRTPTYRSWEAMVARCYNPHNSNYKNYGGKGIEVDSDWLGENGFKHFLRDMGERPQGMTLDRIKNGLGYSKSNCRWTTMKEQQRNRGNNVILTYGEVSKCINAWADVLPIKVKTLQRRYARGWTDAEIINTPLRGKRSEYGYA